MSACVTSYAPMSATAPDGSGYLNGIASASTPRWSSFRFLALLPWSIAMLPLSNACVSVGPPLLRNGPSNGQDPLSVSSGSWLAAAAGTYDVRMKLLAGEALNVIAC